MCLIRVRPAAYISSLLIAVAAPGLTAIFPRKLSRPVSGDRATYRYSKCWAAVDDAYGTSAEVGFLANAMGLPIICDNEFHCLPAD